MNSIIFTEKVKSQYPNMDKEALALASRAHYLWSDITVEVFAGMAEMFAGYSNDEISDRDILDAMTYDILRSE